MRRVPPPLRLIMLLALVQGFAWACVLPAFQGQDEPPHFAYTQRMVELGKPTWSTLETIPQGPGTQAYSTEVFRAQGWSALGPLALNVDMKPYTERIDERRWRTEERRLTDADREDGMYTSAMRNPPLYYVYEAAVYAPLQDAPFFTRWFAMRLATLPFLLVAVVAAWLLAGEVFGRRRWLQAVTALTVGLQPMLAQLGGVINPDAMIAAVWGLGLYLAARIVNRGLTRAHVLWGVALFAGAVLTHPRAMAVAAPLVLAALWRLWPHVRARGIGAVRAAQAVGVGAVLVLAAGSVWYALVGEVSVARTREFGSYLWQFYLPRPGFMEAAPVADWGARDVFVDRLWSGFALLEVNLAPGVLDAVAVATILGGLALLATFAVRRAEVRRHLGLVVVLGVALPALMWSLHVAAWRDLPLYGDPIITGRYLTPLLPLAGLAVATVAASLPRRIGPAAAMAVLGLEVLLALSALGTAVVRFYV